MRRVGLMWGVPLFAVDAWETDLQAGGVDDGPALLASEWQVMVMMQATLDEDARLCADIRYLVVIAIMSSTLAFAPGAHHGNE